MGQFLYKGSKSTPAGFTLVELIVALAVALTVMGAVYSTYKAQQDSYIAQEQVAEMQENLRAALYVMAHEIRMAGFDPTGNASATVVSAADTSITFTQDINDGIDTDSDGSTDEGDEAIASDGDVADRNENITYTTAVVSGVPVLQRQDAFSGSSQTLAEYIDGLGFAYAFDNDLDGELDASGGNVIWAIDSDADGFLDLDLD
ncbi:MAG: prepilin-type N-terminal cleavage/methylation domain-containing protein, partial [Deltaproteobacteria bacterium]|nr:prepilin-type N-terminal cleavage/methylation domain-containing protein [Deltaproteobacteria bacterium]